MVAADQNGHYTIHFGSEGVINSIKGDLVRLRPFEEKDIEDIMEHVNNPLTRYFLNEYKIKKPADKRDYIHSTKQKRKDGTGHIYAITRDATGEVIGSAGIEGINPHNKSCYFGIVIYNPKQWDRGYGSETTWLMCNFAFYELGMHTIKILVYEYNKRAQHVYTKAGFHLSGRFRQGVFVNKEFFNDVLVKEGYYDVLIMDLIEGELNEYVQGKYTEGGSNRG